MSQLDIVTELEHYLAKNALDTMVKEMMVECLKTKPEEPLSWMMKYILNQNANLATSECAVASTSEPVVHVALSHADAETQQYLTDKKIHLYFMEMLRLVVKEKPDNVLSFLATQAHNIHKSPPPQLQ
mmetsp:Transcript_12270/g.26464  ORF Transcript_12270/g.26464 Transcript_12270/m.26464 type:complete len:128 (-) Transcript_12270:42-425(-)